MKISYFFISTALATVYLRDECTNVCDSDTDTCISYCTKYSKTEDLEDQGFNSKLVNNIRLSFDCSVEDAEMCNDRFEEDQEYYDCLVDVGCLKVKGAMLMKGKVPEFLWPAVQKYYQMVAMPRLELQECETCKDEYFADDFYACVYYNCQDKLKDSIKYLNFIKKSSDCSKCNNRASADTELCIWSQCRSELVNKHFLFKDLNQDAQTCSDCESIVFADDYYNCISLYCSRLWSQENLNSLTTINENCEQCRSVERSLYEDCACVACKEEIVQLGGSPELIQEKKVDCGKLLDEEYQECVSRERRFSGVAWGLAGVFVVGFACVAVGWRSKADSYRLIVS